MKNDVRLYAFVYRIAFVIYSLKYIFNNRM